MRKEKDLPDNKSSDSEPKSSIAKLKSMNNSDEIRKYLIENRSYILGQIDLGGNNGCGSETVRQLNSLFNFVFKYLEYEDIFHYLRAISLGVYIDDGLDEGFQIGFYRDTCNLILNYFHTDVAKRYLDEQIYWLFPYFLEINDRDEELRNVLLSIKDAWLPLCRLLDRDDLKSLKRIFGTTFSKEWY
ncbi:MAG: hypothetical protein FK734_15310 [Asgard group archaeon]|nr:hypothetical protein [Asgard group archaeon]